MVTALDLVSSLTSLPQANADKVAFVGHSNGGGISQLAMVVDPRIKVVVLHGPVSSDMADNGRKWWTARGEVGTGPVGRPDQNPDGYRHISPRNYFQTGQAPVLILQGSADHTIPADWTAATYEALQRSGIETRLVWFPGADHDMVGADLAYAVQQQESWIREHLGV
jgi:acylaminoacyl-peptidase